MKSFFYCMAFSAVLLFSTCTKDKTKVTPTNSGYPENIAAIIDSKCSIAGCHNTQSKSGAAGLDLSTWDKAMEGGTAGAAIIPYSHKQSTVFLFCNTDSTLGARVIPTMPYNQAPLSRNEVITLRDWIDNGAPNKDGFIKFSDNPQRHKMYITNQGCDLVAVVDAESKLIMRYISVGNIPSSPESPHMVRVSANGSFWCVCFIGGTVIQKYSTATDELLGQVEIGSGSWNTFVITQDGTKAYCADFQGGDIVCVDLVNYTKLVIASGLTNPHGTTLSPDEKFLYVTGQFGNFLYKIDVTNYDNNQVSVDGNPPSGSFAKDIHDVVFSPDHSKYFVTCQTSNEVRVMNAANDSLLVVIPVGKMPQEFAISTTSPYLFVTCMDDNAFSQGTGSVAIINYNTLTLVKSLYTGWQPHGIAVDEEKKLAYVANRNATTGGPAPHHTTDCGGRNGYLTLIDLNTLEMVPSFKTELTPDPYSVAYR